MHKAAAMAVTTTYIGKHHNIRCRAVYDKGHKLYRCVLVDPPHTEFKQNKEVFEREWVKTNN